ncbi:hypothetical protein H7198_01295 [Fructobacillus sp. CRL 2054]|uniref:hypothetical protein n=1 Tax=Fructobacillus sp. CRL 2054 TaxID=2763007 RepID=UPI002378D986|nr:hypothetical protein [Fructobacillus sp. CRL 2054]MDD9138247.1 hypothetical protein [Fructobacillus sp. CRL 2054]
MNLIKKIEYSEKVRLALINTIVIAAFATLSLLPAFIGHFYSLSFDGIFHLDRFASVSSSFKDGSLPTLFNFKYAPSNSQPGVAINAMYPWVSGLIFIIPSLLIKNQLLALAIGFFILNVITIVNIKALISFWTKKPLLIWLGVIVYQFNNLHFIDLYSRSAFGEALGYAWMPLVILGVLKIQEKQVSGTWILGLAVGMIINSHVLSVIFAAAFILIFELYQIFNKKFGMTQFKLLFFAGIISLLIGIYSLYNIAIMYLHARFLEPGHFVCSVDPVQFFDALLQNDMNEKPYWTYGLPLFTIQIILTVIAWNTNEGKNWRSWLFGANAITLIIFSWLPWYKFQNTPLSLLQFFARLEVMIVLLLTISIILYFLKDNKLTVKKVLYIEFFIIIFSMCGTYQMHKAYNQVPQHHNLTSKNYYDTLNTAPTAIDYLPVDKTNNMSIGVGESVNMFSTESYKELERTSDSVKYQISSDREKTITLPAVMYDGFKYDILLDGKPVKSQMTNLVKINVTAGEHSLVLKSVHSRNYPLFVVSIVMMFTSTFFIFKKKTNK